MYRRRSSKRIVRPKRPTERFVRAGKSVVPPSVTTTGYVWTAVETGTVTNIKLDTGMDRDPATALQNAIAYALVYVPEGYNANALTFPALTDDLYNPTKNVLISGVLNSTAMEDHKFTKYSRKVVRGDRLCLLYYNTDAANQEVSFELNFTQAC